MSALNTSLMCPWKQKLQVMNRGIWLCMTGNPQHEKGYTLLLNALILHKQYLDVKLIMDMMIIDTISY